jgi:TM2 domain-containing membrane protein YozV
MQLLCDESSENNICICPECGNEIVPVAARADGRIKKTNKAVSFSHQENVFSTQNQSQNQNTVVINNYTQPYVYSNSLNANSVNTSKSRLIYIIFGLFFGGLGAHNFYAGYILEGFIQLILSIVGIWTAPMGGIILNLIVGIWAFANIICRSVDSENRPMV